MTTDDKFGFGAGLSALGLGALLILLAQVFKLTPREPVTVEILFDILVLIGALPAGIYFFVQGALAKDK